MFYFTGGHPDFQQVTQTPWWMLAVVLLWCMTIIPLPASMDIRGWAETNPLNGPVWSLQWEYLANILYALVLRRLSKPVLGICVALFGVLTLMLCLNIDWLGVLQGRTAQAYTVIGGWSLTPDQLLIGATRLLYPFFMGLLISRVHKLINVRAGFWWCSALVVVVLVMPRIGGQTMWLNGLYEAVVILLVFPLVVSMGAGSGVSGRSARVCKFFGEISYPLYLTHYPLVYLQMSWFAQHRDAPASTHVAVAVSLYVLAVFMAWAAYKLYDVPVRDWLRRKLFKPAA
jgi:peptidoglycan/LPS O-acetylase OafA/YrhL